METATLVRGAVDAPTLVNAFRRTAEAHGGRVAIRERSGAAALTFAELRDRADALAGGLAGLGVGPGDTVALMLSNRPEFHVADLAAVTLGATPFSIYWTASPEQIAYVCADAGARVAIVGEQFLEAFRSAGTGIEHVIGLERLDELEAAGAGFDGEAAAAAVQPGDVATLIYTSGTTGPPKGVQLSHANVMHFARLAAETIDIEAGLRVISWLPAAHIAERASHHYIPLVFAGEITCCPNPREILSVLPEVRPNWFFGVPRIWEKLKAGLEAMLAAAPEEEAARTRAALDAGIEKVRLEQRGRPVPRALAERVARADREVFSDLRAMLGLDQALMTNVGAAPTPAEVIEFFHAIGIELSEFWGMSETGVATINRPGEVRIGTVGRPIADMEVAVAADGELLIRGPGVMLGYRGMPELTAQVLGADGWMKTGDIGSIDDDGYVRIVDRKKELIINAAGKNMSPANIEAHVKVASPLIGHVCAIGDGRAYNTALIVLDSDYAPAWAAGQGIAAEPAEQLAGEPLVIAAVADAVQAANSHLSRVEQIKRFHIVPGDWAPGCEELTPTMKLRRKPIAEKYSGEIEGMYTS